MDNKLRELLTQLHTEIEQVQSIDQTTRIQLEGLSRDINALLSRTGGNLEIHNQALFDQLGETIREFEVSHPQMTTVMTQVIDMLRRTF